MAFKLFFKKKSFPPARNDREPNSPTPRKPDVPNPEVVLFFRTDFGRGPRLPPPTSRSRGGRRGRGRSRQRTCLRTGK